MWCRVGGVCGIRSGVVWDTEWCGVVQSVWCVWDAEWCRVGGVCGIRSGVEWVVCVGYGVVWCGVEWVVCVWCVWDAEWCGVV